MPDRRSTVFRFCLDALVRWAAQPDDTYRVDLRRYVDSHGGTWNEYALADTRNPHALLVWAHEADVRAVEE